jgi:hypothetical protein
MSYMLTFFFEINLKTRIFVLKCYLAQIWGIDDRQIFIKQK